MRKRSHLSWLVLAVFTMTIFFGSGLTAVAAPGLSDVQGHWAADTIQKMVDAGVVAGQPDGTFKPDNNISRAEFATLVVKAFKLEEKAGKVFADTSDHWAKAFISTANANGIVSGYSDTEFGPNDPITREQMAVMIVKAAGWKAAGAAKVFPDDASISAWAKEAVSTASAQGVIKGRPDGNFDPKANATRAEAAVVISGTLDVKAAPEKPVDISTLDKAGTYGPASGSQEINGNVTISASGVILQNAVITGDLLIAEGVGSGEATLKNVTVKGTTTIKGGETVNFENCKLGKVNIKKAEGKSNVVLSGTTSISELLANSAVKVSGQGTIDKAVVYVANVVIEPKPVAYEVASGITANIGGIAVTGTTAVTSGGGGGPTSSDDSNRVKPVNVTPPAGEVPAGTQVTLSTATAGATIYYTLDGSVPSSNSTKYTAPITINAATTIKAIAIKAGQSQSVVATYAYSIAGGEATITAADVATKAGAVAGLVAVKVTFPAGVTNVKITDVDGLNINPAAELTDGQYKSVPGTYQTTGNLVTFSFDANGTTKTVKINTGSGGDVPQATITAADVATKAGAVAGLVAVKVTFPAGVTNVKITDMDGLNINPAAELTDGQYKSVPGTYQTTGNLITFSFDANGTTKTVKINTGSGGDAPQATITAADVATKAGAVAGLVAVKVTFPAGITNVKITDVDGLNVNPAAELTDGQYKSVPGTYVAGANVISFSFDSNGTASTVTITK